MLNNIRKITARIAEYGSDRRAAISPMMVFMLIPLSGVMALAGEVSFWFMTQRALQNAADSAAVAAAMNNSELTDQDSGHTPWPRYKTEALSVARGYGFQDNANGISISVLNKQPCPDGDTTCYKVSIDRRAPLFFSRVVGYTGDTGGAAFTKLISANSLSKPASSLAPVCIGALSTTGGSISPGGNSIKMTGTTDLTGCTIASNYGATCSGSVKVSYVIATNNSCTGVDGNTVISSGGYEDPYAGMNWDTLIPTSPCTSTPLSDITNWTNPVIVCTSANATLTKDVNITTPNATIIMVGQTLRVGNFTLRTSGAGSATIVFTSTGGSVPTWMSGTGGGIEIAAPNNTSTAPLKNFALVGDPRRTTTTEAQLGNYKKGGNTFNMNILGGVYAPNTDVLGGGNIVTNLSGYHCISLIAKTFDANGGKFDTSLNDGCGGAGILVPQLPNNRPRLVG